MALRLFTTLVLLSMFVGCPASTDKEKILAITGSRITHVVVIVQENHTFDSYFGRYCTAPAGSNPSCTTGPNCCEAGPSAPNGMTVQTLTDNFNLNRDLNHSRVCEVAQINGGAMDRFGAGANIQQSPVDEVCNGGCSNPLNIAYADQATAGQYWTMASQGALADRYFQPVIGATTANTMYFATAHWQFDDSAFRPASIGNTGRLGQGCLDPTSQCLNGTATTFTGRKTIADILVDAGITFASYTEGYRAAQNAAKSLLLGGTATGCATADTACPYSLTHDPDGLLTCIYEPGDSPWQFYQRWQDNLSYMKDYQDLALDIANNALPNFVYIHGFTFRNEHPNWSKVTDGIAFVNQTIAAINASPYKDNTLILVTWDEGGGHYDHVSPVAAYPTATDKDDSGNDVPHGTRIPLLAIGPFARKNTVSHVVMDHSSIVKFLEYNFTGQTGQLAGADRYVNNIGSLLDPTTTGIIIPEGL